MLRCCLFFAVMLFTISAYANSPVIEEATLKNGLRVILVPNRQAPVVTQMIWYKIGAIDEVPGKSGLAHFLEHLMFKGTDKYPSGQFSALIARNGGEENAFTAHDYTGYYQTIAANKLELVMALESNRMQGLTLIDAEVIKERDVILEERRYRVDNTPHALLEEQMWAALFLNHPYGRPVIGWKHEMESLNRADALAFYHRYYAPNNAILVVSGDIDRQKFLPLAEKYYGVIPKNNDLPQRLSIEEPPAIAARHVELADRRVASPELLRYYLSPVRAQDNLTDSVALKVLAYILGGGDASRLYQMLVEKEKTAVAVDSNYDTLRGGPALFTLIAIAPPGQKTTVLERSLDREIARMVADGITKEELSRAKKLLRAQGIYAREGVEDMAKLIGKVAATGVSLDYVRNWDAIIESVTQERVNHIAKQIFVKDRSVTGALLPVEKKGGTDD